MYPCFSLVLEGSLAVGVAGDLTNLGRVDTKIEYGLFVPTTK